MFEDYLIDSSYFFKEANKRTSERDKKRFYRASVFFAASCMEAFVNYLTDILEHSNTLNSFELNFLLDQKEIFDLNKFKVKKNIEFHNIENKLKFLIKTYIKDFNFKSKEWNDYLNFKDFRNKLVHPRILIDEIEIQDYKKEIKRGLTSIIYFINILLNGVLRKPLRKNLMDLIP